MEKDLLRIDYSTQSQWHIYTLRGGIAAIFFDAAEHSKLIANFEI